MQILSINKLWGLVLESKRSHLPGKTLLVLSHFLKHLVSPRVGVNLTPTHTPKKATADLSQRFSRTLTAVHPGSSPLIALSVSSGALLADFSNWGKVPPAWFFNFQLPFLWRVWPCSSECCYRRCHQIVSALEEQEGTLVVQGLFWVHLLQIPSNWMLRLRFFLFLGPHGCSSICGVYWVTEGAERCLIGRVLSPDFKGFIHCLEGHVGQVVIIFPGSNNRKKLLILLKTMVFVTSSRLTGS